MEKMTKTQMFEMIKELLADNAEVVEFCDAQIEALANKAAKAKAKAAEKRAAGDELYAAVVACLTSEGQTREDILNQVEGEDLSVAKIGARLTQAIKNGVAVKDSIKVEGKTKTTYKLAE
jgi:uncharacterized protein (DUF885 family)